LIYNLRIRENCFL